MNAVLAWLWQGTAITAAMWVALRSTRRLNAATRHALWWATLVVVLLLPAVRWLGLDGSTTPATGTGPSPADTPVLLPPPPDWTMALGVGVVLGIVGLRIVGVVQALVAVSRLKASATALPAGTEARLPLWTAARATGRPATLRMSPDVPAACALGFRRPAVVVSAHLVRRLNPATVDHIAVHEHAHLARRDDWTRAMQAALEAFFGLHPAVWFIGRRIDFEREAACDDRVAAATGSARRYARALAEAGSAVAARRRGRLNAALSPAVFRRRRALEARVARLLDERRDGRTHVFRGAAMAFAAVLASVLPLAHATGGAIGFAPLVERAVASISADAVAIAEFRTPSQAATPAPSTDIQAPVRRVPERARPALTPAGTPPVVLEATHGADSQELEITPAVAVPVPLVAAPLPALQGAPTPVTPDAVSLDRNPWSRVGDGSVAVGTGVGRAAGSVGGFFNRAGRAVGAAFTRAAEK